MPVVDMTGYELAPKQLETAAQVMEAAARVEAFRRSTRVFPVNSPVRPPSVVGMAKSPTNLIEASFPVVRPYVVQRVHPRIDDIIVLTAQFYRVHVIDIISERRTAAVVRPRQVAMFLSKTMTLRSLPEIGKMFGGKHHTTVMHAVAKIANEVSVGGRTLDEVQLLQMKISDHMAEQNKAIEVAAE